MTLQRELAAERPLAALGIVGASLGPYNQLQTLLDVTQSARVPVADYAPEAPPRLHLGASGTVDGWAAALRRARTPDAQLEPGLLAASIPGGAGYAASSSFASRDALLAAGRRGRIAVVSLGSPASLPARVAALLRTHQLVIADLAPGPVSAGQLAGLLHARRPGELLLTLAEPPFTTHAAQRPPELLAIGATGLAGRKRGALATATTRIDGFVTPLDIAPTILSWLRIPAPTAFVGHALTIGAARSANELAAFGARIEAIPARRKPALLAFAAAWLLLALSAALATGRRGLRSALRIGGLAAFWAPSMALLPAALTAPSEAVELAILVGGSFALAAATDRLLPWPRGPLLPAAAMLVLYTVDLANGSPLILRSLLGPNPIIGGRFFGIGNVLEALTPVVLFAGLAALLPQRTATRRDAAFFALAGAGLTVICAWGRLGADVGALFTIGGGTAVAVVVLLPGRLTGRRLAYVVAVPVIGLVLLAAADLATGGGAQYTQVVIHAHSIGSLAATLRRRLSEALATVEVLSTGVAVAAIFAAAYTIVRRRRRVLGSLGSANAWSAALAGGFAGSVIGSVANDSGALLLMVGAAALACLLAYICGSSSSATAS